VVLFMEIAVPFGKGEIRIEIPDYVDVILPKTPPALGNESEIIEGSLENPIGTPKIEELVAPSTKVAFLVSDITRPCPSYKILPHVLRRLEKVGVPKENILILFATGSHRAHTREEWIKLLGKDIVNRYRVMDHNSKDKYHLVYVGDTRRGTPVHINTYAYESDIRIGIANIDAHYFAGYSGGGKSVLPGVAGYESIKANHKLMLKPGAETGRLTGNPVREDLEEVASMVGLEFIVNVVLDDRKNIVGSVAGHFIKAHREGVKIFDSIYGVKLEKTYDIVIASPGVSQKTLTYIKLKKLSTLQQWLLNLEESLF